MTNEPTLKDPEDFPWIYRATNARSLEAQKEFLLWFRVRLFSLLIAAVGGALSTPILGVRVGAWVAFLAFVIALGAELFLMSRKPERIWYEGRAAAESAKTLTWRFIVCGESFGHEKSAEQAERELLRELGEILNDLGDLDLSGSETDGPQVTPAMRAARAQPFEQRRRLYQSDRIDAQKTWYANKAKWNSIRSRRWTTMVIGTEIVGVLLGGLAVIGILDFDAAGILAAIGAAVTAWVQAKQHQNLATAYSITSQELASISSEMDLFTTESDWAEFVGQAEEAISREHTLWRASRGIRIKPSH